MTDGNAEFAELLEAAQSGDQHAWSILYDGVAGALVAYLRLRGASDPEALVGDAFIQIARHLHGFEGDAAGFRSWAFTIAHNRLIDDRRRLRRRPVEVNSESELDLLAKASPDDVEELAISSLNNARIETFLEVLSEDQRNVVLLKILGGLPASDTAKTLGKTEGTIRVIQHRAIKTLRQVLADGDVTL
ncbi:MAG TPA: sigma-70 family RNA polymerase sigma factor [Actinobacteria bacterium]|nr:sigma-70 family RNA polymerase sigma factor [Actinomycetota bacterium]